MSKKFDALFRRTFNSAKLKNSISNAIARIAILKKQHEEQWHEARTDVVKLLSLDHHESATLRVDHVIREQRLLDALVIIEAYCMRLMERIDLIKSSTECPEELKEAIASLVFAASRFGQLPELQMIYKIFTKKYGKWFINSVTELHNNCGVNPKIAKKLQTRRASLKTRLKVLKQIAAEHSISLQIDGESTSVTWEKVNGKKTTRLEGQEPEIGTKDLPEEKTREEIFSVYLKARKSYKDVKQATHAAYKLATEAAAAAKVAMELSQTNLSQKNIDDSNHQEEHLSKQHEDVLLKEVEQLREEAELHVPNKSVSAESNKAGPSNTKAETQGAALVLTSESDAETKKKLVLNIPDQTKTMVTEGVSDEKEDESKSCPDKQPWWKQQDLDTEKQFSSFTNEFLRFCISDAGKNESTSNENTNRLRDHSTARIHPNNYCDIRSSAEGSSRGRRPISVRTRKAIDRPSRARRLGLT